MSLRFIALTLLISFVSVCLCQSCDPEIWSVNYNNTKVLNVTTSGVLQAPSIELAGHDLSTTIQSLLNNITSLQSQNSQLVAANAQLSSQNSVLTQNITDLFSTISMLSTVINNLQNAVSALQTQSNQINNTVSNLQTTTNAVSSQYSAIRNESTILYNTVNNLNVGYLTTVNNVNNTFNLTQLVPGLLPSYARRVLFYLRMYSGTCTQDSSSHNIWTQPNSTSTRYLMPSFHSMYNQDAVDTTSFSFWLPIFDNRLVYWQYNGARTSDCGNFGKQLTILGWS